MADIGTVETVEEILALLGRVQVTPDVWQQLWNRVPMAIMVEVERRFAEAQ